jgi:hypothetical protein
VTTEEVSGATLSCAGEGLALLQTLFCSIVISRPEKTARMDPEGIATAGNSGMSVSALMISEKLSSCTSDETCRAVGTRVPLDHFYSRSRTPDSIILRQPIAVLRQTVISRGQVSY